MNLVVGEMGFMCFSKITICPGYKFKKKLPCLTSVWPGDTSDFRMSSFILSCYMSCIIFAGYIKIENDFLQSSFSILENQPMDMLLGLDMLKRHQVIIGLYYQKTVFGV